MLTFTCTTLSPDDAATFADHLQSAAGSVAYQLVMVCPVPVRGPNVVHVQEPGRIGNIPALSLAYRHSPNGTVFVAVNTDTHFVDGDCGERIIESLRRREESSFPFVGGLWQHLSNQFGTAYGLYYPNFPAATRRSIEAIGGWYDAAYKIGWGDVDIGMRTWQAGGKAAPLRNVRIIEETRPAAGDQSRFRFTGGSWDDDFRLFVDRYHPIFGRYFCREFREINVNYAAEFLDFEETFRHNLPADLIRIAADRGSQSSP